MVVTRRVFLGPRTGKRFPRDQGDMSKHCFFLKIQTGWLIAMPFVCGGRGCGCGCGRGVVVVVVVVVMHACRLCL